MIIRSTAQLSQPSSIQLGTFNGISYTQYDGIFEGQTSTGAFRVPYRITAPSRPICGNQAVLVEPSHFNIGLGALERYLGQRFLFTHRFAHAGIGWSTTSFDGANLRILDPTVPDVFIDGGFIDENGRTDDEIIIEFAKALTVDHNAKKMLGKVNWKYVTGFSDSSDPVLRLIASGRAKKIFDLAIPFIAEGHDPQAALCNDLYDGKLIILNSEFEDSVSFIDHGRFPNQYRSYAVAGTGHVPDHLVVPSPSSGSTPASFSHELRAHFLQGHNWVMGSKKMPLSTHLKRYDNGTIKRDMNGNAITVDTAMNPVPRLPFIELGEAHFITGFIGSYEDVKTINDLGFKNHHAYVKAFKDKLLDYMKAGYILKNDADDMLRRAKLCPKLTFMETYRDHYDNFVAIVSCV